MFADKIGYDWLEGDGANFPNHRNVERELIENDGNLGIQRDSLKIGLGLKGHEGNGPLTLVEL